METGGEFVIAGPVRLGDLLIEASYVSRADLDEAVQIGRETGMRVGRVLIVSGWLSEQQLCAALRAQTLINDGRITRGTALRALRVAQEKDVEFDRALQRVTATRMQALVRPAQPGSELKPS